MNERTKDDTSQVDVSGSSFSTDMSMLDELFPSLGNGMSSTNHFTNQLAFLLNKLGSSDDEGTDGANLLSPLQLSPPKLNEIHALATASLISQTQEAIMQEYNITDLDLEKTVAPESDRNEPLQNECYHSNNERVNTFQHNILENGFPGTNNTSENNDTSNRNYHDLSLYTSKEKNQNSKITSETILQIDEISKKTTADPDNTSLTNRKLEVPTDVSMGVSLTGLKENTCLLSNVQNSTTTEIPFHTFSNNLSPYTNTQCELLPVELPVIPKVISHGNAKQEYGHMVELNLTPDKTGGNIVTKSYQYLNIHKEPRTDENKRFCSVENLREEVNTYTMKDLHCDKIDQPSNNYNEVLKCTSPIKRQQEEYNLETFKGQRNTTDISRHVENLEHRFADNASNSLTSLKPKDGFNKGTDKGIVYLCVMCRKQFTCIDDLEQHSSNHQQYSCPYPGCVRTFTYRSNLSYHKQTHEGVKQHQCSECGKVFTKAQHLDVHMSTHSQTKPFTCHVCNKGFNTIGNLKNHTRTHSGERPYSCDVKGCTKSFAELSSLKKHKISHSGVKCYKCDICGKSFTQAGSRSHHMKKHKMKSSC